MSEIEHITDAGRWLRYAREDLEAAEKFREAPDRFARHVCWLSQQSGEKSIKAILVFLQIDFPFRHDLEALRNMVPDGWVIKKADLDLPSLTEWAVEARYPGEWPEASEAEAESAYQQAKEIYKIVSTDLSNRGLHLEDKG